MGILKNWLDRAVSQAIDCDKRTLPMPILKQTALDQSALARIANELNEAEQHRIWSQSNHDSGQGSTDLPNLAGNGHGAGNGIKNGKLKPGERKAVRDKTGVQPKYDNLSPN